MVVNDAATRRYHVGRENTANENYELYSDDTIRADDHAFILKMQDTVKAAGGELANAVTKHSQKITSYDRATDLEAAGYSVLTMNPKLWNRINAEAAKK